jgi:hypothetical protein
MSNQSFQIPEQFLVKLYELTGSADKNKGFILFLIDNDGNPRPILSKMDMSTNMCLRKCAEIYLRELDDHDAIGSSERDDYEE